MGESVSLSNAPNIFHHPTLGIDYKERHSITLNPYQLMGSDTAPVTVFEAPQGTSIVCALVTSVWLRFIVSGGDITYTTSGSSATVVGTVWNHGNTYSIRCYDRRGGTATGAYVGNIAIGTTSVTVARTNQLSSLSDAQSNVALGIVSFDVYCL